MENTITEIDKKEPGFRWPLFFLVSLVIVVINIVLLYMFPGNIYSDIAFVFAVLFIFKLLEFTTVNLLICSVFYLILASIVVLIDSYNVSRMFLENMSFYAAAFFILAFVNYVYEEKAEKKLDKRKKIYFYLSIAFVALYLFSAVFFNRVDIKVHFFNRFMTDKYFKEVEVVQVDGRKVYNEMIYSVERPGQYYIVEDYFDVKGWAVDKSDIEGTKIDYVAVYSDGEPGDGGKFIARCDYGVRRNDPGEKFTDSGFSCKIDSNRIGDGIRDIYVCIHSKFFGWKYEEITIIVNNEGSFVFEEVFMDLREGEFINARISEDGEGIVMEEGSNMLKSASFKVDIESGKDYIVSFKIRALRQLDNIMYFDFFGEGYDDPDQEFSLESNDIGVEYKKVNRFINSGIVPGEDIYFRIFTYSGGSLNVDNPVIYEVIR
jgi:hypothetical protein